MVGFIKKMFSKYREIIMYGIFGVATTGVNWIFYVLSLKVFGLAGLEATDTIITICNGIAWFFAVTFAFFTSKLFVFESKGWEAKKVLTEGLKFYGSRVVSGIFEIGLPTVLINLGLNQTVFGIDGAIAKLITSFVVIVMNYVLSKLFVFRKKDKTE